MGNYRQKKTSGFYSVLSAFKPRRARGGEDSVVEGQGSARRVFPSYYENEAGSSRKVYPSDYDKKHGMFGDHRDDSMADDFIKRVRKNHITASESQTMGELHIVTVYPAKNQESPSATLDINYHGLDQSSHQVNCCKNGAGFAC